MATESEIQSEAIKAAGKAAKREPNSLPREINLSNGIVLKVRPMPPMLLNSVANSIPEPEVPKVFMEDKGREEPNPNHPDYIKAVAEYNSKVAMATMNLIFYACTSIKEIPDGLLKPEDDDWVEMATMAKISFDREDKAERYIAWLRCYALETISDLNQAQTIPLQLAGITESEVQEAVDAFRSGEGRDSDNGIPTEVISPDGDNIWDNTPGSGSGD